MTFLRSWLLSVTACAVLVSIVQQLTDGGTMKKIVRFVGGMVLMLAMLRPLLSLTFDLPELDGGHYREAVEALKETLNAEQDSALGDSIAAQTQAYIEDKASSLGLSVRAEVQTALRDGVPFPDSVTLYGENSAARRVYRTGAWHCRGESAMDRTEVNASPVQKALQGIKKYKYVLLTALLGVLLLLLPQNEKAADSGSATPSAAENFDREALQNEMEDILSSLDGVGKLSLMLTVEGGGAYELAQDETASLKARGEEVDEQTRKTETVVLGSGTSAEVVVTHSRYPRFVGALIVCEGGDRADVQLKVTQAVSALTGLSSERISVVKGTP